jgi:peptidoglycan/LPS O-acetylase OafA/YrhL
MRRVLELDALRGVFALVIMAAHIGLLPGSPWVLSTVDLFFVLSGYLITRNVLKDGRSPGFLPVFFARRALRIWPAYYVAFAACLVLNRYLPWDKPPTAWPYYLTFTQNVHDYVGAPAPPFSGMFLHTWTLAIEEQFYLLWPLLVFRAGRRTSLGVVLAFAALPPVMRGMGFSPYLLLTRCDGLALGSLLAWLLADPQRVARRVPAYRAAFATVGLAALFLPMLGFVPTTSGPWWDRAAAALFTTRTNLIYFGLAGFTLCTQGHPALAPLRDRRLCHLGLISYGLYLYHPLVFASLPRLYIRYVERKLGLSGVLLRDLAMLAVSVALAELSRRLLEDPIVALKERLTYRGKALGGTRTTIAHPGHDVPGLPHAATPAPERAVS